MDLALHELLARWANFYLITGSAAAALTGLQFVVQTLLASDELRQVTERDPEGGIEAFGTPTVVHFTVSLGVSALMCIPWPAAIGLKITLGVLGLAAVVYSIKVMMRANDQRTYTPVFEDWLFHVILPGVSYVALFVASLLVSDSAPTPLFLVAAAALLLICVGIHNAWDTVTYLTIMAVRGETMQPKTDDGRRSAPNTAPKRRQKNRKR